MLRITGKTEHELTLENKVDVTWHRQKFDARDPRKGLDPRTLTHSKKGGHPYHGSDLVITFSFFDDIKTINTSSPSICFCHDVERFDCISFVYVF